MDKTKKTKLRRWAWTTAAFVLWLGVAARHWPNQPMFTPWRAIWSDLLLIVLAFVAYAVIRGERTGIVWDAILFIFKIAFSPLVAVPFFAVLVVSLGTGLVKRAKALWVTMILYVATVALVYATTVGDPARLAPGPFRLLSCSA